MKWLWKENLKSNISKNGVLPDFIIIVILVAFILVIYYFLT